MVFFVRLIAGGVCDLPGFLQVSAGSCSSRDLLALATVPLSPPLSASRVVCWALLGSNPPCPQPLRLRRPSPLPNGAKAGSFRVAKGGILGSVLLDVLAGCVG